MSERHVMEAVWHPGGWSPTLTVRCESPRESLCHAVWTCKCEEWDRSGIDSARNLPYHDAYDEEAEYETVRHWGTFGDECSTCEWLNNSDDVDEIGRGKIVFPIQPLWNGSGFDWEVIEGE